MSSNPKYPNLELMQYQFMQRLKGNEAWKKKIKEIRESGDFPRDVLPDFDVEVFSQVWGSACMAFDEYWDGSPVMAGQAMAKAYTVVIEEALTKTYGVFVDDTFCYMVDNPSKEFFKDLSERNMKSLSVARKSY